MSQRSIEARLESIILNKINMTFEDFLKKVDKDINPDRAYKLYLQVKISILEELIIAHTGVTREIVDSIEEKVLNSVVDSLKKK